MDLIAYIGLMNMKLHATLYLNALGLTEKNMNITTPQTWHRTLYGPLKQTRLATFFSAWHWLTRVNNSLATNTNKQNGKNMKFSKEFKSLQFLMVQSVTQNIIVLGEILWPVACNPKCTSLYLLNMNLVCLYVFAFSEATKSSRVMEFWL